MKRISGELEKNNHCDSVAIGIEQGIYDEKMAYEYFKWIVRGRAQRYLTGDIVERANVGPETYTVLLALDKRWGDPTQPNKKTFLKS